MNLRPQIKAHLKRTGTTQGAFAKQCGRSRDWLMKYLAGSRKTMKPETIAKVREVLGN